MALGRAGRLTSEVLRNYRETFTEYKKQFESPVRGISTIDLLEAMAVTESFRSTVPQVSSAAFREYLGICFPDPDSVYRRVLTIVRDRFGEDAALDLTSRLCFLALNGDTPAKNFWFFVEALKDLGTPSDVSRISAWDLALGFGMNPEQSFVCRYKSLSAEGKNRLLPDYVELLLSLGSSRELWEFTARPGDWFRSRADERLLLLAPPLVLCSGGRGHIQGLAQNWSKDRIFQLLDAAALIGIGERLLTDGKPYQVCPHTECPIHETELCHTWYAVPQRISWAQCAFPKRLEVQFRMAAKTLMDTRSNAGGKD